MLASMEPREVGVSARAAFFAYPGVRRPRYFPGPRKNCQFPACCGGAVLHTQPSKFRNPFLSEGAGVVGWYLLEIEAF